MVSATGQLTRTQLRRSPGARVAFKPGARQNFSGQVLNFRDNTAWPHPQNETHPNVEISQRQSKRWEHVVYNAVETLNSHTGSLHCSSFSCLKLLLRSFTWWTSSLNSVYPQSGRQWEDSLAFPSLTGSLHTHMYVHVYISIFTCISSKGRLGDLKGPELNTSFCL